MTQRSVNDLRKILVASGKFTKDQVDNIKGKSKLSELVLTLGETEDEVAALFDAAEIEELSEAGPITDDNKTIIPDRLSADWQSYVLGLFRADELDDGYPKVTGLRRVSQILLGPIISSLPTKLDTIVDERNLTGRTSCIYEVTFNTCDGPVTYGSASSSWSGNTDDEFAVFTEAIAEVRAESRALRKALNITIVSKEETTSKNVKEIVKALQSQSVEKSGGWEEDDNISVSQELMIKKTSERCSIDLDKLLKKENLKELHELTKKEAIKLIDLLNQYQNNSKESIEIPAEIKKG